MTAKEISHESIDESRSLNRDFRRMPMPRYFGDFIRTGASPGLIVVPQILAIRDAADALILIWAVTKPEEWVGRVAYLPI